MGKSSSEQQWNSALTLLRTRGYAVRVEIEERTLPDGRRVPGRYVIAHALTGGRVTTLGFREDVRNLAYGRSPDYRNTRRQERGYATGDGYDTGSIAKRLRRGLRLPPGWQLLGVLAFKDGAGCDGMLEYRAIEARDAAGAIRRGRVYENARGGWEQTPEWL